MHVWRDVLWGSFTDELTKIARANAVAKTMRMPSGATRAAKPPNMLKNIRPAGNMYPARGYQGPMSTTPNMVKPRDFQPPPGSTMQAPSMQVTGAGPVGIPTNMPNPVTQAAPGMPPLGAVSGPPTQRGPMNMMNTRRY